MTHLFFFPASSVNELHVSWFRIDGVEMRERVSAHCVTGLLGNLPVSVFSVQFKYF